MEFFVFIHRNYFKTLTLMHFPFVAIKKLQILMQTVSREKAIFEKKERETAN